MSKIVHLIRETRSHLTAETQGEGSNGKITGAVVDLNGVALGRDEMHRAREVYMDSFSGAHFVRVSHEEKEKLTKDDADAEVYQGVGEVHGWFTPAPDLTVNGRFGDGAPTEDHEEQVVKV